MYYVVDKIKNDLWISGEAYTNIHSYKRRPWARAFRTFDKAAAYAERNNPENLEIEAPSGKVYAAEEGRWAIVFS